MFVVTEKTVEVLRALKLEGMCLNHACEYLNLNRSDLRKCAIRDGYWDEIRAMFPAGGSKPASEEGGMRTVTADFLQIERPAGSRWLTTAWRKTG